MKSSLFFALALLGFVSCSSTKPVEVNNALMAKATPESRAVVAAARSARDVSMDELAIATVETGYAEDEVQMAKLSLKTATAEADQSKLAVEIAETSGSPDKLKAAATKHTQKLALAEVAKEVLAVERQELELAEAEQEAAEATHELRLAQVEEAKAIAVQDLNLVEVRNVPLAEFRKRVATQQREVEVATGAVENVTKRLKVANQKLSKASAYARSVGVEDPSMLPAPAPKPAAPVVHSDK